MSSGLDLSDNLSLLLGRHMMRFGFDIIRERYKDLEGGSVMGVFGLRVWVGQMRASCLLGFLLLSTSAAQKPTTTEADLLEQANSAYRQLHSAEAVRLYRQYLKLNPNRADVHVFLGAALLNLNQPDEALEEARRALQLDNRLAKSYVLEGRVFTARQQWDLAMRSFHAAIELEPRDPDAWYFAGRAAYEANRFEAAASSFDRALRMGPAQSRVYEGLGLTYEALGRDRDAEHAYRQAIALAGASYRPAFAMGRFLFMQGRAMESLPFFDAALQRSPSAVEVRFEMGRALYQLGHTAKAERVLREALPTQDCRVYYLLAKIVRQRGIADDADRWLAEWRDCSEKEK